MSELLVNSFLDYKDFENNSIIDSTVCIIGAGAAGITLALELSKSKINVILL